MKYGTIFLYNKEVKYRIRKHKLAKRVNLQVFSGGIIMVTIPEWIPYKVGRFSIDSHKKWILKSLKAIENKSLANHKLSRKDYLENKERARDYLYKKLEQLNFHYNFQYGRIYIKDQKTCWGSCSSRGNLNFSYKILFLSEYLADYIVVHELCHLSELNHSPGFWKLVERVIPDHKNRRKKLKKYII